MKKLVALFTCAIALIATLAFSSCSIMKNLENAVIYPESYSITYEVTTAEGIVKSLTKTVDANGNVYTNNGENEQLFINQNGTYTLYERNETGAFVINESQKYTKKVVDEKTADINKYSEESKKQFMPTAKLSGSDFVLGRECDVYKIGVGGKNNSAYYYYYADKLTGICLKLDVKHTALGQEVPHNTEVFVCTFFCTENVQDLSALI